MLIGGDRKASHHLQSVNNRKMSRQFQDSKNDFKCRILIGVVIRIGFERKYCNEKNSIWNSEFVGKGIVSLLVRDRWLGRDNI